ncbi:hypothetical protein CDAR_529661 [Caerostris darwini]|uniref:Uncharacterized protein n=1 Tax=Caerostris darwini TaxID=1538125 RepID=A0AAV4SA48_9ARAC|nr:hypothetical protein CDAR_529661 [Caerostris darwini]
MDRSAIFSLSPGAFFLILILFLFCLLLSCIVIGKLCKKKELCRTTIIKQMPNKDQDHCVILENDKPPPYNSNPPSYEEALRNSNHIVNVGITI